MGFYIRKSISVGPFRFNLSNSGVGVSAGVKGLRFGTGPRGNYVHIGRGGLYYRATIPQSHSNQIINSPPSSLSGSDLSIPIATHEELKEIDSISASQILDSNSKELLSELNEKQKRVRFWPLTSVFFGLIVWGGISSGWPSWLLAIFTIIAAIAVYVAYARDVYVKSVVVLYDFDAEMESAYAEFHEAAVKISSCAKSWHIEAEGEVLDRKYHAGAGSLVRRKDTFIKKASPPYVKTNIETVEIGVGAQVLHFFPDRVLIYDKGGVGAVSYQELAISCGSIQFIEESSVPRDAKIIDTTWKYVNKSGGPDRRFKDNRQLPVCQYDQIAMRSGSGLNELVQISRSGVADDFVRAVKQLSSKLPKERMSAPVGAIRGA